MSSYVFWLRKGHQFSMYATVGGMGGHSECVQLRAGGAGSFGQHFCLNLLILIK